MRYGLLDMRRGKHRKYLAYAFREQGVAMLSSVLRSDRAIEVNIAIMRPFVRCERTLATIVYSGSGAFRVSGKKGSARKPTRKQEHITTPASAHWLRIADKDLACQQPQKRRTRGGDVTADVIAE